MRKIAIFNQKGGVAKTTTTINLGAALARLDKKVLIIDLDAQANASTYLGFKKDELLKMTTIYECLVDELPLKEAITMSNYEYLDIVPSNKKMSNIEQILTPVPGRETLLKDSIDECISELDYDYILIDFPPALGIVSLNGLVIADDIIIPVEGAFALEGVNEIVKTIKIIKKKFNSNLEIMGALLTKYKNTNLASSVYEELNKYFGDKVFKNVIRDNIKIGESQAYGKPVIYYDKKCAGTDDYMSLAEEVLHYGD